MNIQRFYPSLRRLITIEAIFLLLLTPLVAHAEVTEEEVADNCQKISEYSAEGGKFYKLKQYAKARAQYEQQVGWSESCQLDEDKIAMAYNNVALTYIHEGNYLKARAWLSILPDDKKSIFNLGKISAEVNKALAKLPTKTEGQYWQYAGASLWNSMTIEPQGKRYKIDFQGYSAGLMAMYSGPNIGEFSALVEINNGKAHYAMSADDDGDCAYDFDIQKEQLTVKRTAGEWCGFGHNVGADGVYHRVEL
ncbi:tetratricopeptide repeat protein [Pseudomonas prosekii]|uniref:Tetratricopeptide repeat-containing protein n=1 Tax=Pseudomonas prosekii TaxID=1148509 RepID=A0A2U2D0Z7_9PSED|nr:tetratricopeptide repeat-containing protein [Pseudomonas prosekii]PWE39303.1 tetratricopeptide repeat-containing protein [Pseudomonas prosekii]